MFALPVGRLGLDQLGVAALYGDRVDRLSLTLIAEPQKRDEHERKGGERRRDEDEWCKSFVKQMLEQEGSDDVAGCRRKIDERHHHRETEAFGTPRAIIGG